MKANHIINLACPVCNKELELVNYRTRGNEIIRGKLQCKSKKHFFPIVLGRPILLKNNCITQWIPPMNRAMGINKRESFQASLLRFGKMGIDNAISEVKKVKYRQNEFNQENFQKYFDQKILNKAKYRKSGKFFDYYNRRRFKEYAKLKFIRKTGNELFNQFLDVCLSMKPKKILDLASGSGSLLTSVVNNLANIDFAYGVDNDIYCSWSLQYRLNQLKNAGNTEAFGADVRYLPFKDNLFDLVSCNVSLTEIQGISQLLTEAFRVLRVGGRLVICNLSEPFKTNYYQTESTSWIKMKDIKKYCKEADLFFDFLSFNKLSEKIGFKGKEEFFFSRNNNDYFVKVWCKTI